MATRALTVPICMLAVCLLAGGFALAQEQESPPETAQGSQSGEEPQTEEEKRKALLLEQALRRQEGGLTETVKVTATRVETELMKTPVAVTVLDQDTLDREGIQSVAEMAENRVERTSRAGEQTEHGVAAP